MLRCCLKTLTRGLTDEKEDIITWVKESYTSLIDYNLIFVSPQNNSYYDVGETISNIDININALTSNDIAVKKIKNTTERYRLKKVVNGVEVVPTEYKDNGAIYIGTTTTTSEILNNDSYEINLEEID